MIDPRKHGTNPEWIMDEITRADERFRNAHTPSQPSAEVRRQLNDMQPKRPQIVTLFLLSVFSILLLAFVVAFAANASPDFSAWVEAMNVHPDCDTPAC